MIAAANAKTRGRPLVVELVGPAGAGKSTLAQALSASIRVGQAHSRLMLWGLPRHRLLANGVALSPAVVRAALAGRPFHGAELAQMLRLGALRDTLRRELGGRRRLVVMDEGPVFALSWFEVVFGRNGDPGWARWRHHAVREWAAALDVVVRVDAPDALLAQRLQTRAKPHRLKGCRNEEVFAFAARYRAAIARTLDALREAGLGTVLTVRTDRAAPHDTAVRLRCMLESLRD